MPYAGGVSPPVITPLRATVPGRPATHIDTSTYVELETETPNCHIYFTTNGSKPNPYQMRFAGKEITFRYSAPFTLKPGKRTLKCISVHRISKQESYCITKNFVVDDLGHISSDDLEEPDVIEDDMSVLSWFPDNNSKLAKENAKLKKKLKKEKQEKSKHKEEELKEYEKKIKAWTKPEKPAPLQDINKEGGFCASNGSGTQVNLFGGTMPIGWDIKTPQNSRFGGYFPGMHPPVPSASVDPGVSQQQLNAIANHLTQQMNQTRELTVADVRNIVKELDTKKSIAPPVESKPKPIKSEEPVAMDLSSGNGDLKKQMEHIYAHLLQYGRTTPDFAAVISQPRLGKIISCDFEEGDDSYLLTIQLKKQTSERKPLSQPKHVTPKFTKTEEKPTQPKPAKAAEPKPIVIEVPKGHEVEKEVIQPKGFAEKAPVIELKKVEKPPELIEEKFFETEEYVQDGTLKKFEPFDADADCQKLRTAMKGLGTDEKAIIDVLSKRSISQRAQIVVKYKTLFGKDLTTELASELSGNLNKICQALCLGAAEYDGKELRRAMKGLGTDEDALIELICTRTNEQLKSVKQLYTTMFPGHTLEKDIETETSGSFKRMLISLIQAQRDESPTFDPKAAKEDAQKLFDAGEKKWGTDESMFNQILCSRSNAHLRAVFREYENLSKKTMEEVIKNEMSGDVMNGMLTLVRCIVNKPAYFAQALQKSMKGLGTNDEQLLRIIITRCEVDMVQIKAAFQSLFKETLASWIKDDTSGDYRNILLSLIGENLK